MGLKEDRAILELVEKGGPLQDLERLLNSGSDVNTTDEHGSTLLLGAVRAGNPEIVKFLVRRGALVDAANQDEMTPLVVASLTGHVEVAKALLKGGANPSLGDYNGKTAFIYSSQAGRTDIVQLLLESGVHANSEDAHNRTSLTYAAEQGCVDVAEILLSNGGWIRPRKTIDGESCRSHSGGRALAAVPDQEIRPLNDDLDTDTVRGSCFTPRHSPLLKTRGSQVVSWLLYTHPPRFSLCFGFDTTRSAVLSLGHFESPFILDNARCSLDLDRNSLPYV